MHHHEIKNTRGSLLTTKILQENFFREQIKTIQMPQTPLEEITTASHTLLKEIES